MCDGNKPLCESVSNCHWAGDNQICAELGTCRADCIFCPNNDGPTCTGVGAGGNSVCNLDYIIAEMRSICVGETCNTACVIV